MISTNVRLASACTLNGYFQYSIHAVFISDCDPSAPCRQGIQVVINEIVVPEIDIFVSSTGNFNLSTLDHMKKLKNSSIVGSTGHFDDEIDFADSESLDA